MANPPRNVELWRLLAESGEAVDAAFHQWRREHTPETQAAVEQATHAYAALLAPIIGNEAAFKYEAAFAAFCAEPQAIAAFDLATGAMLEELSRAAERDGINR